MLYFGEQACHLLLFWLIRVQLGYSVDAVGRQFEVSIRLLLFQLLVESFACLVEGLNQLELQLTAIPFLSEVVIQGWHHCGVFRSVGSLLVCLWDRLKQILRGSGDDLARAAFLPTQAAAARYERAKKSECDYACHRVDQLVKGNLIHVVK